MATIFLANRECPFRCVMCDLWRHTLRESVPRGAIPAQIRAALARLPPARWVKLYNAGSYFDPRAIPPEDDPAVLRLVRGFERVIVEAHPAFVGERCRRFAAALPGRLEVAMGLETSHPRVLALLNKRMTLDRFRSAAAFLCEHGIDLRVFILVRPPFMSDAEGREWASRSLDFAFACGAAVCSLIPTRGGNGALEALAARGEFAPPSLAAVEAVLDYGLRLRRGRVLVDLWEIDRLRDCEACWPARRARLVQCNHTQQPLPPVRCEECGAGG